MIYDLATGRATVTGGARTVLTPKDAKDNPKVAGETKEKR